MRTLKLILKSNRARAALLSLAFLGMGSLAHAEDPVSEQRLIAMTTDAKPGVTWFLNAELNGDSVITGINYTGTNGEYARFTLDKLPEGLILSQDSGRDLLVLQGKDFDPTHGGNITLKFLRSGITYTYNSVALEAVREGDEWKVYANDRSGRRRIRSIFLHKNTLFGQVIGFKRAELREN